MSILIPIIAVTVIGVICAVGLSVASHFMAVPEDERFPELRACLPGANCGACGYSGCDGYARAMLEKGAAPNLCVPGGQEAAGKLGDILGVKAGEVERKIAVVHCSGDCVSAPDKQSYHGIGTCAAAKQFFGGPGGCAFGCLGFGDCLRLCPNGAIAIENGIARIDPNKCVGCGLCAKNCPQRVIALRPAEKTLAVLCSNTDKGALARKVCVKGCIGCKKCEKTCPNGAIAVKDNLARIDLDKCTGCGACKKACTTGCIGAVGEEA